MLKYMTCFPLRSSLSFRSVVLKFAAVLFITLINCVSAADDPTGQILRDFWTDISGTSVTELTSNPDFPKSPSGSNMLNLFEAPTNWADDYGTLVRGYVHPPITGQYIFWIASDDNSELWLSTTDEPAKKVKIAAVMACTAVREWTREPGQKSQPITLTAGKKYYIEALQKEGGGDDNLAVGWTLPDKKEERPIPGSRLSPFKAEYTKRVPVPPTPAPTTAGFHKMKLQAKVGGKTINIPFLLYLPVDYAQTKDNYPALLFLHGAGEGGTDLGAIYSNGPAIILRDNENFRKTCKFIGIFPQSTGGWDPPWSSAALQVLDYVSSQCRVDKDRVYCTGLSMGGRGTWITAEEGSDRFAAILPMDPFAFQPEVAKEKLKNVSAWIIVGAEDGDHTTGSKQMYATLKGVGADVYLTVVPHCGHGAWGIYYPDPTIYEWLLKHRRGQNDRIAIPGMALSAPANNGGVGSIRCEYWRGIGGGAVGDLTKIPEFPSDPDETCYLADFEIPRNQDDNYGTAVRGFIYPPADGQYTFWVSSDDSGELWLSPNENPKEIVKIAWSGTVGSRAWDAQPNQRSKPITLSAGKRYYIQALQKESGGEDHLAVGWQLPDGQQERPIPGKRLSPAAPPIKEIKPLPVAKLLGTLPTVPGMHKLKAELTLNGQKSEMAYVLYLPKNYDKTNDPFPLFTFLHGNGHQGNDWNGIMNEGPPQYLNDNQALRDWMPMIGFFPQCPNGQRWDNRPRIRDAVAVLDEIIKQFKVDAQRVYCTGLSMGGMGTWNTALEAPDRFAAIAPISAVAVRPQIAVERLKNVPIWIIAGGNDGGFTDGSNAMKEAFENAGRKDVECIIVPGEGHGVWGRYYPDKRFYEWLLKHRKAGPAPPREIVQVAAAPVPPVKIQSPPEPAKAPVAAAVLPAAVKSPPEPPKAIAQVAATATPSIKNPLEMPKALAVKIEPAATKPVATATSAKVESASVASTMPVPAVKPDDKLLVSNTMQSARTSAGLPVAVTLSLAAVFMALAFYFFMTPESSASPPRRSETSLPKPSQVRRAGTVKMPSKL